MSGVSPVTVIVPEPDWVRVAEILPGVEVAVKEMISEPPLLAGAWKETLALEVPIAATDEIVGAPGTVRGVDVNWFDAVPAPSSFTALI